MSEHSAEWCAGYDEAVREYESWINKVERRNLWWPYAGILLVFLLGAIGGYALAVLL